MLSTFGTSPRRCSRLAHLLAMGTMACCRDAWRGSRDVSNSPCRDPHLHALAVIRAAAHFEQLGPILFVRRPSSPFYALAWLLCSPSESERLLPGVPRACNPVVPSLLRGLHDLLLANALVDPVESLAHGSGAGGGSLPESLCINAASTRQPPAQTGQGG